MKPIRIMLDHAVPKALTVFSIVGVGATGILAARGGYKAGADLEPYAGMSTRGKFRRTWKNYIPAVVSGAATIAAILAGHHISAKHIASLTAACGYLAAHRDAAVDVIHGITENSPRTKDISAQLSRDAALKVADGPISCEITEHGDLLCLECYSGRWFRSSQQAVEEAVATFNDRFMAGYGEHVCLNDFYELLGISRTHFGNQFGWPADPDYYNTPIHIEDILLDHPDAFPEEAWNDIHEPILVIEIFTYPMECWWEI